MTDIDLAAEQLRRDIEHTREDLARLASALAERAEVRARTGAKVRVRRTRQRVKEAAPAARDAAADAAQATAQAAADAAHATAHGAEQAVVRVRSHPTPLLAGLVALLTLGVLAAWAKRSARQTSAQPRPPQQSPPYTPQPASRV